MGKLKVVETLRGSPLNPKRTNEVDEYVGHRLRLRRTMLSLGQDDLAAAVGVTYQQIQKYERGETRLTVSRLYDIAFVLGVPLTWFLVGFNDMREPSDPPTRGLQDVEFSRELSDLIQLFSTVEDPKIRRRFLGLVRALTEDDSSKR